MTKEKLGEAIGGFFRYETIDVQGESATTLKKLRGWWMYKFPGKETCGGTFAPEFAGNNWNEVEMKYAME